MKCPKLLAAICAFLMLICFFRTVNGAPYIGASDVLGRLQEFDFDITPVQELIDAWSGEDSYFQGDYVGAGPGGGPNSGGGSFGNGGRPPEDEMDWLDHIYYFLYDIGAHLIDFAFSIGRTLEYIWNDGLSLFSLPIDVIVQTWDFTLWLLGFA